MGNATRFSDHEEEESFRQARGREIDLGFQHPYGKFTYSNITSSGRFDELNS
jgi:hypothetical protein